MGKRVQLHGDLNTVPVLKTSSIAIGVSLSIQPSASVTVTFDSVSDYFTHTASLTFTTSNWATPQTLTITGVNDASTFGLRKDTLTIVCSGGGYDSISSSYTVNVYDSGINKKFLVGFRWINEITVTNSNISTKRSAFIDRIFPTGFPSNATPSAITTTYTGSAVHNMTRTNLTGYSSIDKITFTRTDGQDYTWTHIVYHIKQASPIDLIVIHIGHGSAGGTTQEDIVNNAISEGYDVLVVAMPVSSNCENTEDNPNVSSAGSGTANHNTILSGGLDSADYLPIQLYLFSAIEGLNYLDDNYSYSNYYAIGISGGAWSLSLLAALDNRLKKTFCVRGVKPRSFKVSPDTTVEPDYEQGGTPTSQSNCGSRVFSLYTDYSYMDIILMAMSDSRTLEILTHPDDPEELGGYTYNIWKETMEQKATNIGGEYLLYLNPNAGQSAHIYQAAEITEIFSNLP